MQELPDGSPYATGRACRVRVTSASAPLERLIVVARRTCRSRPPSRYRVEGSVHNSSDRCGVSTTWRTRRQRVIACVFGKRASTPSSSSYLQMGCGSPIDKANDAKDYGRDKSGSIAYAHRTVFRRQRLFTQAIATEMTYSNFAVGCVVDPASTLREQACKAFSRDVGASPCPAARCPLLALIRASAERPEKLVISACRR